MESAKGYSKEFWERLRQELKAKKESIGGSWDEIGNAIGIKGNTLLSFVLGRCKGLSQETLVQLEKLGIDVPNLVQETTPQTTAPLEDWGGERKTVAQASEEKGYSQATIRKYCKSGKLDWVRKGKRTILVVVNEKYQALPKSSKAILMDRIRELENENAILKRENEEIKSGQLRFEFEPVVATSRSVPYFMPAFQNDFPEEQYQEEKEGMLACLSQ